MHWNYWPSAQAMVSGDSIVPKLSMVTLSLLLLELLLPRKLGVGVASTKMSQNCFHRQLRKTHLLPLEAGGEKTPPTLHSLCA